MNPASFPNEGHYLNGTVRFAAADVDQTQKRRDCAVKGAIWSWGESGFLQGSDVEQNTPYVIMVTVQY